MQRLKEDIIIHKTMSEFRRMIMMFTRPVENQGVPAPTISPVSGSILSSQVITISIEGIAVSAEYSFDNSTWVSYSSPFTLSSNATVYARALDADGNYSNVVSNSYIILPYDAEVEYLQTTGTQYISTGISPSSITPVIEVTIYKPTAGSSYYPLGADGSGNTRFSIGFLTNNRIEFRIGSYKNVSSTIDWHIVKLNGGTGEYFLDGVKKGTLAAPSEFSTMPILLFTSYSASNAVRTILSGVRISSFKLWNGSTLLQDMISVRVGTTGYMYDKVSGQLFGNAGTGSFTLGNDITN